MAQQVTLQASTRTGTGKSAARALRREGKVPAVIYGHNREPESLVLDAPALSRALAGASSSTMLDVAVEGRAPVKALLREIQRNPVKPIEILHVDLYEVRADEQVDVSLPIQLTGTADGVRNFGGVLDWVLHSIDVRAYPADLPERLEVDVTNLGIGQSLYVRDLQFAKGEILTGADLPVASVVAPRVETEGAGTAETPSGEPELIRKPKPEEETGSK